jgi:hypothetical protein
METERIGADPKIHAAVRDTNIEQRTIVAPQVKEMANIELNCLDGPRAGHRIHPLAD